MVFGVLESPTPFQGPIPKPTYLGWATHAQCKIGVPYERTSLSLREKGFPASAADREEKQPSGPALWERTSQPSGSTRHHAGARTQGPHRFLDQFHHDRLQSYRLVTIVFDQLQSYRPVKSYLTS